MANQFDKGPAAPRFGHHPVHDQEASVDQAMGVGLTGQEHANRTGRPFGGDPEEVRSSGLRHSQIGQEKIHLPQVKDPDRLREAGRRDDFKGFGG